MKQKCILCGKKFSLLVDGYFHGRPRVNHLDWWAYQVISSLKKKDLKFKVVFKNKFFKVIAYTELQRKIIYALWYPLFGWQRWDYWECQKCAKLK